MIYDKQENFDMYKERHELSDYLISPTGLEPSMISISIKEFNEILYNSLIEELKRIAELSISSDPLTSDIATILASSITTIPDSMRGGKNYFIKPIVNKIVIDLQCIIQKKYEENINTDVAFKRIFGRNIINNIEYINQHKLLINTDTCDISFYYSSVENNLSKDNCLKTIEEEYFSVISYHNRLVELAKESINLEIERKKGQIRKISLNK